MVSEKLVETARGQQLAEEYGIKFFETSAKSNINVVEAFTTIAAEIKRRLMDNPTASAANPAASSSTQNAGGAFKVSEGAQGKKDSKCC